MNRRDFLRTSALSASATLSAAAGLSTRTSSADESQKTARIAISLDLEMSRNFPTWDQTHWDYDKGNLDQATKEYATEAARRVKAAGGRVHFFAVGRTLEQANVDWLAGLLKEGHAVGNHTYDHVNLLAKTPGEIQYRFKRAPWLIEGEEPLETIARNIRLMERAMLSRLGAAPNGFRTPGGFANGLRDRPDLQAMLLKQGYTWVSSLYPAHEIGPAPQNGTAPPTTEVLRSIEAAAAAARPFVYPSGLVEIPMSPVSDIGAFRNGRWPLASFVECVERCVAAAIEHRRVYDFLAHPSCLLATDPEFRAIDRICGLVRESKGTAKIVTLDAVAAGVQGNP